MSKIKVTIVADTTNSTMSAAVAEFEDTKEGRGSLQDSIAGWLGFEWMREIHIVIPEQGELHVKNPEATDEHG